MPLDSAIQNVGEYYAAHYLAGPFEKDIAPPYQGVEGTGLPGHSPPAPRAGRCLFQGQERGTRIHRRSAQPAG